MIRFNVVHIITSEIIEGARQKGMPEDDDCVLDWVESDNFERTTAHTSFIGAVADAKSKLGEDFFGCPRIYMMRYDTKDDTWFPEAFWEITDDTDEPDFEEPTHRYDLSDD